MAKSARGPKPKTAAKSRPRAAVAGAFALPEDTPADVAAEFARIRRALEKAGLSGKSDPQLALSAARSAVMLTRAWAEVERLGLVLPTNNGMVMQNPACAVIRQQMQALNSALTGLGLTAPGHRYASPGAQPTEDRWAGLLGVTG